MNVHRFARSVWLRLPPALRRELAERLALRPPAERPRRRESPVVAVTSRQTTAIADLHARFAATPNAASPRPETGPPPAGPLAVAVVVPVYNGGAWLSDCLESVRRQTYDAWRCYVVDDASTDETAATASSFAARDSRFVALRHGRNAGLSASRNTGLAHAGEPLVTFLDADDLLTPSSLRRREAVMRRHWRDTAVAGAWGDTPTVGQDVTVADSETFERDSPRKPTVHADSHGGECPFNVHAPLLRADLLRRLGGFDERLRRGAEDWDLWHRLLRHGYTLEHACGPAGLYRRRPQGMAVTDTTGHLDQSFQLLAASQRRVRVDERLVVDPHAAAPLARRQFAASWLRRVATYHGMHLPAGGDRDTGRLAELIGRGQDAPRALLGDLEQHVRSGLRRGLGIGGGVPLPEPEAAQIGDIARAVAEEIEEIRTAAASASREDEDDAPSVDCSPLLAESPPREDEDDALPVDCSPLLAEPDVVVVAETAADVRSLVGFVRRLRARGWDAVALDADYARGDQGATRAWQRTDVPLVPCNHLRFGRVRAARMLVCRPFGPLTAGLAAATRGGGGVVVEWSAGVAEARLPCNDTESMSCDGRWTADMQVPEKKTGVSLDPVAIRAVRTESPADSVRTDAGFSPPGPVTHCLDIVREEDALDHESTALIESLRDRHRGETVVVIGNGPSLNDTNLGLLAGVATIGVNGIFYAQDRLPEPLTYYVVEDTSVFRENTAAIKAFECGCKLFPTLYRPDFRDDEIDRARVGFFRMNWGFYGRGDTTLCVPRFSTDAVQRLYCGQSVTIINLQLAWWMGFSRVVLIGMDFSYTIPPDADREGNLIRSNSDDVNHFHPDYFGKGKTWKDPKLDRVLANYALAREMFAADGREIVNATVGGRLEVFRRMPLARALGEAARSSEPHASRFRAAAPPPPRAGRPARRDAADEPPAVVPGKAGGKVDHMDDTHGTVPATARRETGLGGTGRPGARRIGTGRKPILAIPDAPSQKPSPANPTTLLARIGRSRHIRSFAGKWLVSFSALGLFGGLALTGAGIAGVAGWSAWLAAAGLTLLGLVGMKEAILWRWRREQERTKLRAIAEALAGERDNTGRAIAGERDNTKRAIAEALAGERDNTGRAIAGERDNTKRAIAEALAGERENTKRAIAEALAGERDNTGRAIAEALAGERDNTGRAIAEALAGERENTKRAIAEALAGERDNARRAIAEVLAGERDNARRAIAEALAGERENTKRAIAGERERAERALAGALAQERSGRSLVDVHLADRGLPLRRVLLLFTMHRSGSTWLFDMLRTHPAIRVEPTTRAWTALGIDGWRYPGAFHHVQGASMPLEVAPGLGAAIPVFPRADVPDTTDVREADRWVLEKAYPQFVGFEASRLAARVRNLRENGLEIEIVYGVRCPLDAMWSMVEYKNRNSQWDKTLPVGEVPRFFARSLEVLAEVRALLGGSVIEYETLPNSAVLNRLGRRLDSGWHEAAARAWLAHAASATERSRRAQRPNAGFLGARNRSRDQAGPDGAWRDESDAVAAARDAHRRLVADERPS